MANFYKKAWTIIIIIIIINKLYNTQNEKLGNKKQRNKIKVYWRITQQLGWLPGT